MILEQYRRHATARHLDVGPGTGYYLDRCFRDGRAHITLMDPNPSVLRYAAARLRRFAPVTHRGDVLKPIALPSGTYGSIGLSYVLHCLPDGKFDAFDHLVPLLAPGGVLFGSAIMAEGVRHNAIGRALMRTYNRRGIFSNVDDSVERLRLGLKSRFMRYEVRVQAAVALFTARVG